MLQKSLPIGIQSISKLFNGNYLYVDKTEEIHRLDMEKVTGHLFPFIPRVFPAFLLH